MTKRKFRRRRRRPPVSNYYHGDGSQVASPDPSGISVDQSPDELFEQAMGLAFHEAEQDLAWRRERAMQRVQERYGEFVRALNDYGIQLEPGEAQKFEIPLPDDLHHVWVEVQN